MPPGSIGRWFLAVAVVLGASWFLFAPSWGFYHDQFYGVFDYMSSGGEDATPGDFVWFGERYWVYPSRLGLTLAAWLAVLVATNYCLLRTEREPFPPVE